MLVLSTAIGGTLPLSVTVYRAELDCRAPGAHAGPFRANQLDEHAAAMGARQSGHLRAIQADHPCLGDVRGPGLMIASRSWTNTGRRRGPVPARPTASLPGPCNAIAWSAA